MRSIVALCLLLTSATAHAETLLFTDPFQQQLADGWHVLREDPAALRVQGGALEIRIQPGNMWGGANDAKNVLVRPLPDTAGAPLRIAATLANTPTEQYEQIDLVWYYDDSHMVKIGIERVHGQLCVVMGREENDKTHTINIVPIVETALHFRLTLTGATLRGEFRSDTSKWHTAGECDLPSNGTPPSASIQAYQGPADAERWARVTDFRITQPEE